MSKNYHWPIVHGFVEDFKIVNCEEYWEQIGVDYEIGEVLTSSTSVTMGC